MAFWPKLVELQGAVFFALDGNDEQEIRKRLYTPFGDAHPEWPAMTWQNAVNSYNRFEVSQLFYVWREPSDLVSSASKELSHFLVQTWQARLRREYPDLEVPDGWNEQRRCSRDGSSASIMTMRRQTIDALTNRLGKITTS